MTTATTTSTSTTRAQGGDQLPTGTITATYATGSTVSPSGPLIPEPSAEPTAPSSTDSALITEPLTPTHTAPPVVTTTAP